MKIKLNYFRSSDFFDFERGSIRKMSILRVKNLEQIEAQGLYSKP